MTLVAMSTSLSHNPGDAFVARACHRLLQHGSEEPITSLAWDRNPDLDGLAYKARKGNSLSVQNIGLTDMVCVAGTPEWTGRRVRPLVEGALEFDIPIIYMGVGSTGYREYTSFDLAAIGGAKLFASRDEGAAGEALDAAGREDAKVLPCPLLALPPGRADDVGWQGNVFVYQHQNIGTIDPFISGDGKVGWEGERADPLDAAEDAAGRGWTIACHQIEDLLDIKKKRPGILDRTFFSHSPADYLHLYDRTAGHTVASMRLHGAIAAARVCDDVTMLGEDTRCLGAWAQIDMGTPAGARRDSAWGRWRGALEEVGL